MKTRLVNYYLSILKYAGSSSFFLVFQVREHSYHEGFLHSLSRTKTLGPAIPWFFLSAIKVGVIFVSSLLKPPPLCKEGEFTLWRMSLQRHWEATSALLDTSHPTLWTCPIYRVVPNLVNLYCKL